ncbi:MAG: alpha/beta fold hydrolase [Ktedonobacterales bacterium]|jgi:pimeloyl-ACP methyl ester carboxylesterase
MQTQLLPRRGGSVAYDDRGQGPLVVCVPGLGDLRAEYRLLAPALEAAGFRVVTMDLRGHGESSTGWPDYSKTAIGADIVALIRHLGGPALVIGASYAAGAAVCAAAEAPDLIAGVVLIGPFVRDHGTGWAQRLLYSALFAGPWGAAAWSTYFPRLFPSRKPADFVSYARALRLNLRERGRLGALRAMMTQSSADSEAALGHVRARALVVMGTRDPDFAAPRAEAEWIAARLGGEISMIEGAGHYPHVEMPEQAGPAVVEFCRRIVQGAPRGEQEEAVHGSTSGVE